MLSFSVSKISAFLGKSSFSKFLRILWLAVYLCGVTIINLSMLSLIKKIYIILPISNIMLEYIMIYLSLFLGKILHFLTQEEIKQWKKVHSFLGMVHLAIRIIIYRNFY